MKWPLYGLHPKERIWLVLPATHLCSKRSELVPIEYTSWPGEREYSVRTCVHGTQYIRMCVALKTADKEAEDTRTVHTQGTPPKPYRCHWGEQRHLAGCLARGEGRVYCSSRERPPFLSCHSSVRDSTVPSVRGMLYSRSLASLVLGGVAVA